MSLLLKYSFHGCHCFRLEKKNKDCNILQTSLSVTENRLADLSTKYNQLQGERKKLADENKVILKAIFILQIFIEYLSIKIQQIVSYLYG